MQKRKALLVPLLSAGVLAVSNPSFAGSVPGAGGHMGAGRQGGGNARTFGTDAQSGAQPGATAGDKAGDKSGGQANAGTATNPESD